MRIIRIACLIGVFVSAIVAPVHALSTLPDSFADEVERLMPAVVNISTTQHVKAPKLSFQGNPEMEKHLQEFLERMLPPGSVQPFAPNGDGEKGKGLEAQSLGSGFIVDASGYIVTNSHVIRDASEIHVVLSDNTKLAASIVGQDEKTDVALLKVKADKPLPFVEFGDSDNARVGDWVIAIGNPFGLGGTVTAGIISARARNINAGPFDDFIQTDASINRGNSGGPLFNTQGHVIGINTAIFSPSGGSIGIGFAIPAALAKNVVQQLKQHGKIYRGWLGVKIQIVTEDIAESLGMETPYGALIAEVTTGSPAEKAGLKAGDVVTHYDQKTIKEMRLLARLVAETPIGKTIPVILLRDGKRIALSVTTGELKEEALAKNEANIPESTPAANGDMLDFAGMRLAPLTAELRERYRLDDGLRGLLVLQLSPSGQGAKQGLRNGDIIAKVNSQVIADTKAFTLALESAKKNGKKFVLLQIWREGSTSFLTLPTSGE